MWLIILSDQLPIVALVGHYPTNELIGRRLIPRHPQRGFASFAETKPMRSCRRFLAGIPHHKVDNPRVTHPSATPSGRSQRTFDLHVLGTPPAFILSQDQTRHPFVLSRHLRTQRQVGSSLAVSSRDPGQAVVISHLAVRRFIHTRALSRTRASFLTGTVVDACASLPVAVLLSTLQLSRFIIKRLFRSFQSTRALLHISCTVSSFIS